MIIFGCYNGLFCPAAYVDIGHNMSSIAYLMQRIGTDVIFQTASKAPGTPWNVLEQFNLFGMEEFHTGVLANKKMHMTKPARRSFSIIARS